MEYVLKNGVFITNIKIELLKISENFFYEKLTKILLSEGLEKCLEFFKNIRSELIPIKYN
jgi:hypothetical protein